MSLHYCNSSPRAHPPPGRRCFFYVAYILSVLFALLAAPAPADPFARPYFRSFYITPIGAYDDSPASSNYLGLVRSRLLSATGGVQPPNVKVGFSQTLNFIYSTQGNYYDYIYQPAELDDFVRLACAFDLPAGLHVNGTPWADPFQQSIDVLSNFLEKYANGALLQRDRFGRIRNAARAQEPTADEVYDGFADMLEMQLTLSRNATMVHQYLARNCRIGMRLYQWYRELHPDLLVFASMSSEYAQNVAANTDWCDYSDCSKQEFRDWLSGAGLYAGQPQYASLSAFNAAFSGASGFPYPSWDAVQPPTTVLWESSATGRWWQKWHEFRIAQVRNIVQEQIRWCGQAGWSPDRLFGHQIPFNPATTDTTERKYASPWSTTFVDDGGNGITTYGPMASNLVIFNAIAANDKSWGIFEWNPLNATLAGNLAALNNVWNSKAHVLCPYAWYGQPTYQIIDKPIETAIAQFIAAQSTSIWSGLNYWETAPSSRDLIWEMSAASDIENASGVVGLSFSNGIARGSITNTGATLWFDHNEAAALLSADSYQAVSFRLELTNTVTGSATLLWVDDADQTYSFSFPARPGWHVYRINLANLPHWREKRIKALALRLPLPLSEGRWPQRPLLEGRRPRRPNAETPSAPRPSSSSQHHAPFSLDWFRLEAQPCWHFDNPLEIFGAQNFSSLSVAVGSVNAITANEDGYFYLSTDKRDPAQDADRATIEADYFSHARVRITSSAPGSGQFYWWRRDGNFYWRNFPVQAGAHTYLVNLSDNTNWAGAVTRFRLDPISIPGATVSVDYVALIPAMLPPRVLRDDLVANSPAPVFAWDAAIESVASGVTCRLELADDFFFTNVVFATNNLTTSSVVYEGPLRDGLHWWRVRAEANETTRSPWCVPMPLFLRAWSCDRSNDIVWLNDFGAATVASGVWQATITGTDPYLCFNTPVGRAINADVYKAFRCRIKVGTTAVNPAQFFFFPRAGGFHVIDLTLPADNQWRELNVDLSAHPNWTGDIAVVRIDPGAQAGLNVQIDYACLLPSASTRTTAIWTGGGSDNDWNTPQNWQGNNAPLNDAQLLFAGSTRLTPNNLSIGRRTAGITFLPGAASFTLNGNLITNLGHIVNASASPQTINLAIASSGTNWLIDTAAADIVLNGVISGAGFALNKTGTNTLTLTNPNNNYTGPTTIRSGRLHLTGRTGIGPVTIEPGAELHGAGLVNAPLTISSAALLSPGLSIGALTNIGGVSLHPGARGAWELASSGLADRVHIYGTLSLPAAVNAVTIFVYRASGEPYGAYTLFSTTAGIIGASNAVLLVYHDGLQGPDHPTISANNLVTTIVPEPTILLLPAALFLLRRRLR